MRILCLVSDTVRDCASQQRESLLSGLVSQGHQVQEVTTTPAVRIQSYPSTCLGASFCQLFTCYRLWRFLRSWQPDVIHVWNPPGFLLTQLLQVARPDCGLVITALTPPPQEKPRFLAPWCRWLVPTENLAKEWQEWGVPADQIREVPPLPVQESGALSRADLFTACKLPHTARLILCLGPLTPISGYIAALWAADILHYLFPDLVLLLAGQGPDQARLQEFAHGIHADRFTCFLGDRFAPAELVPHCDLVWETTRQAQVTDAVLLAQQFGKPLLSTWHSCLTPLVHPESVTWLPLHDPPQWARHTAELLRNPAQGRIMGQSGARSFQERLASNNSLARHVKQYERLLAKPDQSWSPQAA